VKLPAPPVHRLACPGCRLVLKTAGPVPVGKQIKCPRCKRIFAVPAQARPTKLVAPPQVKQTKLAGPHKAKPTKLAPKQPAKTTNLAPARKPATGPPALLKLACPRCKVRLKSARPLPVGQSIQCPKCKVRFRLVPKQQAAPRQQVRKPAPPRQPPVVAPRARRWPYLAVGLLVLSLGLGTAAWERYGNREIPPAAWIEFAPPMGGCLVRLPDEPVAEEFATRRLGARSAQQFTVLRKSPLLRRGLAGYVVLVSERAAEVNGRRLTFDDYYEDERYRLLERLDGIPVREKALTLAGHAGKELQIDLGDGTFVVVRVYLAEQRLYVLLAGGPLVQPGQGDAARFFESFRILPQRR